MDIFQAIILGIIQGLTEFLPISSSGHVELATAFFNISTSENLLFLTIIHGATSLSTIVVYRKYIAGVFKGLLEFRNNDAWQFTLRILLSAVPVFILGVFFKDEVEMFFGGRTGLIGSMLILTSILLTIANFMKNTTGPITYGKALLIGIAQAIAVLPGISRSGATISTSLMLKVSKEKATQFSFLMVLIPIIGAMLLDIIDMVESPNLARGISGPTMIAGFISAFVAGVFACKWMIRIVNKGKLIYFAVYCLIVGLSAIIYTLMHAN